MIKVAIDKILQAEREPLVKLSDACIRKIKKLSRKGSREGVVREESWECTRPQSPKLDFRKEGPVHIDLPHKRYGQVGLMVLGKMPGPGWLEGLFIKSSNEGSGRRN